MDHNMDNPFPMAHFLWCKSKMLRPCHSPNNLIRNSMECQFQCRFIPNTKFHLECIRVNQWLVLQITMVSLANLKSHLLSSFLPRRCKVSRLLSMFLIKWTDNSHNIKWKMGHIRSMWLGKFRISLKDRRDALNSSMMPPISALSSLIQMEVTFLSIMMILSRPTWLKIFCSELNTTTPSSFLSS